MYRSRTSPKLSINVHVTTIYRVYVVVCLSQNVSSIRAKQQVCIKIIIMLTFTGTIVAGKADYIRNNCLKSGT